MKNNNIWGRFLYALAGIRFTLRTESSFRTDCVAVALVILLLLATRPAPIWWAVMLLNCGLVMAVELLNTAVEKLIDHVHPDLHETVGIVKDTLAAAVLVTCAAGVCVLAAFSWMEFGF